MTAVIVTAVGVANERHGGTPLGTPLPVAACLDQLWGLLDVQLDECPDGSGDKACLARCAHRRGDITLADNTFT